MDEVITFWLDKGVSGFRVDAVNHLFEDPDLRDEPPSGKTQDKFSHLYTEHIYTKDLVGFLRIIILNKSCYFRPLSQSPVRVRRKIKI